MVQIDTHAPPHVSERDMIPRNLLRAMLALVLICFTIVTVARITGYPLIATPPEGKIVASRVVLLTVDTSGAATVHDADGTLIADLSPEEGGFISGVGRVIERERLKNRLPLEGPVTLIWQDTGRISIQDPSTGWSADLMGFGTGNAMAFARLLAQ
ncbi:photosynthetic complex assembly protein PuhC [Sedimentitalea todarodis]|uniref:Photosynthetic complex assembly protein PuhC n=1 Tax=Sedimentitalea todarodis TaxID=1631240 RepID=A0ABU3VKH7_9RHOB|nr:photosynthetic complex assembly protein PuhC [Sedimentitalea todarodis]MDU9006645.1 photosynthetic complex assembly protein PuhC [Sedimentitalea todarodis]